MTGRLAGKTAVIPGGAAGMGRIASLLFARQGAHVAIIDIQEDAGRETAAMVRDAWTLAQQDLLAFGWRAMPDSPAH